MSLERPIRMGLVGLSIMGEMYAKVYSVDLMTEFTAVASTNDEKRRRYAQQYGVQAYDPLEEMLEKASLDAVVIATPDHAHFASAMLALEAGRHVLIKSR